MRFLLFASLFGCVFAVANAAVIRAEEVSFDRDIRPLLAENCFKCHGPDPSSREADLRLDLDEAVSSERGDGAVIVAGRAAESKLIDRITSDDDDLRMPPAETGKRLTAEQIELLRRWIDGGAQFERHWAFEPIRRPRPPAAEATTARNPLDRFIIARLKASGLSLSPQADRATLIRRLYLDLLGLLPSRSAVEAFVADQRPGAYARLVDRLLSSPRFGERWGRHWLDQARYADSHGYTNDNERVMWPYRDWVIGAFNRDLPFDRFTIEQLAGDLLPEATLDQRIATGFHRNTLINSEGGTKADQFRDEQVKDRVDTTGGVWLGLTVGCAKCHSHKYDPISQAEYYQLYAFFNSTVDKNSVPPVVKAPTASQRKRLVELNRREDELERAIADDEQRSARQRAWETELVRSQASDSENDANGKWTVLELDGKSTAGAKFTPLDDGSLLVSGANTIADVYELTARSPLTSIRSVRLEVLRHDDLPHQGPGRADNGNFLVAETWFRTGDGRELRFSKAQADHSQPKFDVADLIDGDAKTGWAVNGSPEGGPNHDRTAWLVLPAVLEVEKDHALTFTLQHHEGKRPYNIGRLRISISEQQWVDAPSLAVLVKLAALPEDQRGSAQRKRLEEAFLRQDAKLGAHFDELQTVRRERDALMSRVASTMVLQELDQPRPTHVQRRGDFLQPAEQVEGDVPAILPPLDAMPGTKSRQQLAQWLVRHDNPLTARVRANRLWMRLFGRGLVETENDFGTQGAKPTHPLLLDWLASEYMRQSWSTKRLLRTIVMSATYRQDSRTRSRPHEVDPRNRLLWRQNRVRVEGEIVRDLALMAGELLSGRLGGPGVYPPQPDGVYAFTQRKKVWKTSEGEDRYRRGMYTFFYRSAPYPMLTTFDAPKFNQTCTRRDRSNTPLQSLTVANDPTMIEAAQALAQRVLHEGDAAAPQTLIEQMFRICLTRSPSEAEAGFLLSFHRDQINEFRQSAERAELVAAGIDKDGVKPAEVAAFVAVARVLLNLDEFITRE